MPARLPRLPVLRPLLAAAALGLGLMAIIASRMATAEDTANYPAASLSAPTDQTALIARGKYLATAADCAPCHTGPGRAPYSGGLVIATPFGGLTITQHHAGQGNRHRQLDGQAILRCRA